MKIRQYSPDTDITFPIDRKISRLEKHIISDRVTKDCIQSNIMRHGLLDMSAMQIVARYRHAFNYGRAIVIRVEEFKCIKNADIVY